MNHSLILLFRIGLTSVVSAQDYYSLTKIPSDSGAFSTMALNNKGQVAGTYGLNPEPKLYIWLPSADHGLEAGLNSMALRQIGWMKIM